MIERSKNLENTEILPSCFHQPRCFHQINISDIYIADADMDHVKRNFDEFVNFAADTKDEALSFFNGIVNRIGKTIRTSRKRVNFSNDSRRQYYERKYQHKRTKRAVEALENWKKTRPQVLLNRS
jgi:hypothetical protein